ncbi:MAG: hypothetical protein IT359_13025 [Gemmatimonadaceae bacterium]|nr:hypothetical protein [Gemmatimonadaceae bacterium]
MTNLTRLLLAAHLAFVTLACADTDAPGSNPTGVADDNHPLQLILPDSIPGGPAVSTRAEALASEQLTASRLRGDVTALAVDDGTAATPTIFRKEITIGFKTEGATSILWWQAIMEFLGNRARQTVSINLVRRGTPVAMQTFTEEESWLIPWRYTHYVNASMQLTESCDHTATASAQHRAWNENQLPFPPHNSFMTSEAGSVAKPAAQDPCPPTVEHEGVPQGGGGQGEKDTDEWYLCWWEVWYSPSGQEIARYFLGCTPL